MRIIQSLKIHKHPVQNSMYIIVQRIRSLNEQKSSFKCIRPLNELQNAAKCIKPLNKYSMPSQITVTDGTCTQHVVNSTTASKQVCT